MEEGTNNALGVVTFVVVVILGVYVGRNSLLWYSWIIGLIVALILWLLVSGKWDEAFGLDDSLAAAAVYLVVTPLSVYAGVYVCTYLVNTITYYLLLYLFERSLVWVHESNVQLAYAIVMRLIGVAVGFCIGLIVGVIAGYVPIVGAEFVDDVVHGVKPWREGENGAESLDNDPHQEDA